MIDQRPAGTALFLVLLLILLGVRPGQSLRDAANGQITGPTRSHIVQPGADPDRFEIPVYFEENRGQHASEVLYSARSRDLDLFLTRTGAVYVVNPNGAGETQAERPPAAGSASVRMRLSGVVAAPDVRGSRLLEHRVNHIRGSDERSWQKDVPTYGEVSYSEVYPGIDLVWKSGEYGTLRYDFEVAPGSSPDAIEWEFEGAGNVRLAENGDLLVETAAGTITQKKPFSYQMKDGRLAEVESGFRIGAHEDQTRVGFEVGEFDPSMPLTIDPTVILGNLGYSTFIGGNSFEVARDIAIDEEGNVYLTGQTFSSTFPATPGTFDTTPNGSADVVVLKFSSTGTRLIYSTFIGGTLSETGKGIAVDREGNAFISGETQSTNFPVTGNPFDSTHNGGVDAFVLKLSADGSSLIYSSYLGGSDLDTNNDISIDDQGNAYVVGRPGASGFPVTEGAFDETQNGNVDIYLAKFNPQGSGIVYSTFLGGENQDIGFAVKAGSNGEVFVTGTSESPDFPTTPGAFDTVNNESDVFVTKFNTTGSGLVFSTFIGGTSGETAFGLAIDGAGNSHVSGSTFSKDYPTTPGAYDTSQNGGQDVFVTKLNADGSALVYSTFVGGSGNESAASVVLNGAGAAHIAGSTESGDFPFAASGSRGPQLGGSSDVFAARISPDGSALEFSTAFGGTGNETANGIVLDSTGSVFLAGSTGSAGFPVTPDAFDTSYNSGDDIFLTKLGCGSWKAVSDFDCDSKTDISVFRPENGTWYTNRSFEGFTAFGFGIGTDEPVPGDYDGDRRTDAAVFRPSSIAGEADFFILNSSDLTVSYYEWGSPGDIPVSGDYDGDGRTDIAVFRQTGGKWFIIRSSDGVSVQVRFGHNGDLPLVMDFDGDGSDDLAVYRPSNGTWYIARTGGVPSRDYDAIPFGIETDVPVAADYDGDQKTDIAVFRPGNGTWYILRTSDLGVEFIQFGITSDIPVPGDYDGDGEADVAVYRNGVWWILGSTNGLSVHSFGIATDKPVPREYLP